MYVHESGDSNWEVLEAREAGNNNQWNALNSWEHAEIVNGKCCITVRISTLKLDFREPRKSNQWAPSSAP